MRSFLVLLLVGGFFAIAAPAHAADGTISGTVTHAVDGTPVVSVYLSAQNTSTGDWTYVYGTDAAGAYTFTLAPGTYDISTYTTTIAEPNVLFIGKTTTVTLASGEAKTGINFALTRRGKFTGHVYASDGVTPVSGATISFTHVSGYLNGVAYATSASNGIYNAMPNPNVSSTSATGTYTMYVTKAGYFGSSVSSVILSADETTVTQDIRLTPGSTVTGVILDASNAALSGATATITKSTTGSTYTALTDASGVFSISVFDLTNYGGSAVADYTISASKTGYITKTASLSIVSDASTLSGNNFALSTAGTITGTTTSSGSALSGVLVTADDGFGNVSSATTDAAGAYTLSSLRSSSRYTITATKTNYVGQKTYNVTVTAGATTSGKNFELPAGKTFSGIVTAKGTSVALEGAVVSLFKRNKARTEIGDFTFTTKSDGTFLFRNVPPGKYRIKVVKTGYITVIEESVTLTGNVSGKSYKLDLGGTISGRLTSGNSGIAGSDIAVYSIKNGQEVLYTTTTSDENGYYLVSGLKKGTYRLRIVTMDFVTRLVNVAVKTGTATTSNIRLTAAGSVSGYIMDKETGLPVSVLVKVVGTSISGWSSANGFFVLDGVPPGRRSLVTVSPYYDPSRRLTVIVTAGRTKTGANFTLVPK